MNARILVVEDERAIQLALSGQLSREGYDVTCAADGTQALACLEETAYDLVLTDLALGRGPDGLAVLRAAPGAAEWPETFDDLAATATAVAPNGDVYIAGEFFTSITFGTDPDALGPETTLQADAGDIFVALYDGIGRFKWAVKAGGPSQDHADDIVVDSKGNAYVAGCELPQYEVSSR